MQYSGNNWELIFAGLFLFLTHKYQVYLGKLVVEFLKQISLNFGATFGVNLWLFCGLFWVFSLPRIWPLFCIVPGHFWTDLNAWFYPGVAWINCIFLLEKVVQIAIALGALVTYFCKSGILASLNYWAEFTNVFGVIVLV